VARVTPIAPCSPNAKADSAGVLAGRIGAHRCLRRSPRDRSKTDRPAPMPKGVARASSLRWSHRVHYDLLAHADPDGQNVWAVIARGPFPADTPFAHGGRGDRARRWRARFRTAGLDPMQAGGGHAAESNAAAAPMSMACTRRRLTRGDVSLMGLGTVTTRAGQQVGCLGTPCSTEATATLPTAVGRSPLDLRQPSSTASRWARRSARSARWCKIVRAPS